MAKVDYLVIVRRPDERGDPGFCQVAVGLGFFSCFPGG